MKYTVTGTSAIATAKGDIEPGDTFDDGDLHEFTNVGALASAGHIEPADAVAKKKTAEK